MKFNPLHSFDYAGLAGVPSRCGVTYFDEAEFPVLVLTELPDNPGTSVTNAVELIVAQLDHARKFWQSYPVDLTIVEHWQRPISRPDTWDLVTLDFDPVSHAFARPEWRSVEPFLPDIGESVVVSASKLPALLRTALSRAKF